MRNTFIFHAVVRAIYLIFYPLYQRTIVKFNNWRFDRRWGVETSSIVNFPKDSDNPLHRAAERYEATPPHRIHRMLRSLAYLNTPLSFFDVGCGKGRVLLIASEYPFSRIVGIEFSPELVKIATNNIEHFQSKRQCSTPIEVVCMDAATYEFPDEDAVIFLSNPFNDEILAKVLENIRRSTQKTKTRYIIYHYPVWGSLLDNSEHFSLVLKKRMYSIYQLIG